MHPSRPSRTRTGVPTLLALTCAGTVLLAGCSAADGAEPAAAGGDGLAVVTSFYPLEWLTGQVAGDLATVSSLTPPGAEPHDHELTPADVAAVSEADLVVYLDALQPAVDAAVEQQGGDRVFDAADSADLDLVFAAGEDHEHAEDEEHVEDEHAEEGAVTDPHFWHDPMRMAAVGDALAQRLGRADEAHAATYTANAAALRTQLEALDAEFRTGLASCASRDLVTSHSAFGYLAEAFDLHQVGISGLAPDEEPAPSALTDATAFVREHDVSTIYFETLVSPAVAETVARETGARTRQLDPIEGLTDASAGADYLALMRANLASLQEGQQCS
ncbi:metal ABC transporter substrate-binding protein [Modestobacter sp. VKM Ac-2986]|uniref:metal ABC transporter substrate-binding protein n=1 Tax=Modestobacter sp. VKM Ac-2986 TaxID=3004140 RepID=UPI0022AB8572|nr:metal ABC transporter substrate-binding protein [Modestobacter sp. VKM Ac-2986]MCZ2829209.1 metal ABC transporter substrate-binding protein [Modestobacter sp. VKM Ac-2986]